MTVSEKLGTVIAHPEHVFLVQSQLVKKLQFNLGANDVKSITAESTTKNAFLFGNGLLALFTSHGRKFLADGVSTTAMQMRRRVGKGKLEVHWVQLLPELFQIGASQSTWRLRYSPADGASDEKRDGSIAVQLKQNTTNDQNTFQK